MTVRITEVGPLLTGLVRLTVTSTGQTASGPEWIEDIPVRGLPRSSQRPDLREPMSLKTRPG
jgi:hypothetical protein